MDNTLIMFWNEIAAKVMNVHTNPGRDSRRFAMFQIAIHNALNTIDEKYKRYAFYHPFDGTASAAAAINTAAKDMLLWALGDMNSGLFQLPILHQINAAYTMQMAQLPIDNETNLGCDIGRKAAEAIIELRNYDGAIQFTGASAHPPEGIDSRKFRTDYYNEAPVPGFMALPANKLLVNYGRVALFVMNASNQFRQKEDPPAQSANDYNKDYEEVWRKGLDEPTKLKLKQQFPGKSFGISGATKTKTDYWADLRQHVIINNFVREVIKTQNLDAWQTARLLALIHTAMADGAICMFEDLYHFYHWRPVTAINFNEGGHPITNAKWAPNKPTPRVPENPSFFGIASGVVETILHKILGSYTIPAVQLSNGALTLTYTNIKAAMKDNAETKIFCGWNFRTTVEKSLKQGQDIGKYVYENAFQNLL